MGSKKDEQVTGRNTEQGLHPLSILRVDMAQGCAAAQRMAQGRGMREQRAGGRRRKKGEGKKKREKEKERMGKRGKRRKREGDVGGIRGGIRGVGRELSVVSTRSDAHEK